jgi:hypothetical protein
MKNSDRFNAGDGLFHKRQIEFHTVDFEFAHGHKPRGRGSWAFQYTRNARVSDAMFAPSNLLYSEAKQWMQDRVDQLSCADVRNNTVRVYVCS